MRINHLPLAEPVINGLMYLANPLAILSNDKECLPWFYSEYVQLLWYKSYNFLSFHNKDINQIPTCIPWLEFQCMDKEFIMKTVDIDNFIINAIDDGWYVFSTYDEFYIPNTTHYQKKHNSHDFMLYGYDLDKKEYLTNIYTNKGILELNIITFSQLYESFIHHVPEGYEDTRINLFRKKQNFNYEFDKVLLVEQLKDYINSTCSNKRYTLPYRHDDTIFGMDIYSYMIDIFNTNNNSVYDLRFLHLLWEHKKCMYMRIVYMTDLQILKNDDSFLKMFKDIENLALAIKYLQIKFYKSSNQRVLSVIVKKLNLLHTKEEKAFKQLIDVLDS